MKGDFTRFTHRPEKHYTRVLKQQGRVDLDADWNELVEVFTDLERTEAIDVIGRCGVPKTGGGFEVVPSEPGGTDLTISRGRIYVDGILCSNASEDTEEPVSIGLQEDLPDYLKQTPSGTPALLKAGSPELEDDGVYLAYLDVWERHVTALEDPDIREVALGGPDTTTRTRTVCQVKLHRIGEVADPLDPLKCVPYPAAAADGELAAWGQPSTTPSSPCEVPAAAGYRGLENRLYRVEIHDGSDPGPPTFKWSRDNGAVVLPIAENGISGTKVTLERLGPDEVLTVAQDHWVEVLGDQTELYGVTGTLAKVTGVDPATLVITLDADVSAHASEGHLKMRRWDLGADDAGALPLAGEVELEDGVKVGFDLGKTYHTGDWWVIPARTREGKVLWPKGKSLPRFGIEHHYCTLAMVRREGGKWTEEHDCRPTFPPLTEVGGGCCVVVKAGDSVRDAVEAVAAAGGGCVRLCQGVHRLTGPLLLSDAADLHIAGVGDASVLCLDPDLGGVVAGGLRFAGCRRIAIEDLFLVSNQAPALVDFAPEGRRPGRRLALRRLTMLNLSVGETVGGVACALRLADTRGVAIEDCRLVAEIGVVARWGDALPDPSAPRPLDPEDEGVTAVGFEELESGARFPVGQPFTDSGVEITGEPFTWWNGKTTTEGFTRVASGGRAGGKGHELQVNNINLSFDVPDSYRAATLAFGIYGGNENLRVNGELRNGGLFDFDGELVGGVRVRVTKIGSVPGGTLGVLRLDSFSDPIDDFAIGGQELWIDDVSFSDVPFWAGDGVAELRMSNSVVRHQMVGIFAHRGDSWTIDGCDVQPAEPDWPAALRTFFYQAEAAGAEADKSFEALRTALEQLIASPGPHQGGPALAAFLWRDCAIERSRLGGNVGAYAWWWIRGRAHANTVLGELAGLQAMWLHDVRWSDNRVSCDEGPALAFAGSYRASLTGNRALAGQGLLAEAPIEGLKVLFELADLIAVNYGQGSDAARRACWWMLEESAAVMGMGWLVTRVQAVVDALYSFYQDPAAQALLEKLGKDPWFEELPGPVLFMLAESLEAPEELNLPALVIALEVVGNDLRCQGDGVVLEHLLTFGGLRIEDNRIDSESGQTVRIDAEPLFANVSLTVFLLRALIESLGNVSGVIEPIAAWFDDDEEVEKAWMPVAGALWRLAGDDGFGGLGFDRLEQLMSTDCRVAGNTLHSQNTAIESNLFELAVDDNHVTLREREISNEELKQVAELFDDSERLHPYKDLLNRGDAGTLSHQRRRPGAAGKESRSTSPAPAQAAQKAAADERSATANTTWLFAGLDRQESKTATVTADLQVNIEQQIIDHKNAVDVGDLDLALVIQDEIQRQVLVAINSYGIWVKGAGCRVTDNHVLVPADLDRATRARGGIRLQGDEKVNLVIELLHLLPLVSPDVDPLLGVTETTIAGNEIIGGIGHGVDVLETPGSLQVQALTDLRLRGNQIRGMDGTGLSIDRSTVAVNVEVKDNRILDCGNQPSTAIFTAVQGGLAISYAALCRLRGNQIVRCGHAGGGAVLLDHLYGLDFSDNLVMRNGAGVYLDRVFGSVALRDNELSLNRGLALLWNNAVLDDPSHLIERVSKGDPTVRGWLQALALAYLRPPAVKASNLAVISDNVLHAETLRNPTSIGDKVTGGAAAKVPGVARAPRAAGGEQPEREAEEATAEVRADQNQILIALPLLLLTSKNFGQYFVSSCQDVPKFQPKEPTLFLLELPGVPLTFDANTCSGLGASLGKISDLSSGVITGNHFDAVEGTVPLQVVDPISAIVTSNLSRNGEPIEVAAPTEIENGLNLPVILIFP